MQDKLFWYRCTDPTHIKYFDAYDHARGLIGFKAELVAKVQSDSVLEFWGHWTDAEMEAGYGRRHVKGKPVHVKRGGHVPGSGGGRH